MITHSNPITNLCGKSLGQHWQVLFPVTSTAEGSFVGNVAGKYRFRPMAMASYENL